jgi:hypothetical protein
MTVESMLSRMSSAELTWWMAYYQLEPFGEPWLRTGVIASTIANAATAGGTPLRPSDFMPVAPEKTSEEDERRRIVSQIMRDKMEER